jgi:hypothetical protein
MEMTKMSSHKIVGYVLLLFGLVVVIIPPIIGFSILLRGSSAIPKILHAPALSNSTTGPVVNLVLFFVLSLILIYAGGVIMGWGVKRLRAVREEDIIEVSEDIGVLKKEKANEPEKSPAG